MKPQDLKNAWSQASNNILPPCTAPQRAPHLAIIPKLQRDHHWHNPWPALPCPTHQTIPVKHPGPKDIDHHHALNPNRSWFQIKGWGRSTYTSRRCELRPWKRGCYVVYFKSNRRRHICQSKLWRQLDNWSYQGECTTSSHISSRLWSTFQRI